MSYRFAGNESAWFEERTRATQRSELIKPGRRLRFVKLAAP